MEGSAEIGTAHTALNAGQLAWLTHSAQASSIRLRGSDVATKELLIAGLPLREPVAAQGPFVMSTDAELRDAIKDYRAQGNDFDL